MAHDRSSASGTRICFNYTLFIAHDSRENHSATHRWHLTGSVAMDIEVTHYVGMAGLLIDAEMNYRPALLEPPQTRGGSQ